MAGDYILGLLINGPQEANKASVDPTLEAHWSDFMNRAFVMLGPARFDEIQAMTNELNQGEIGGRDFVNRSRYVMGADFENLHLEFLGMLKQLGHDFSK